MSEEKKEGMFDKLFGLKDDAIMALKKPFIRKAMKRKFQAAFDDAENKKIDAMKQLDDLRKNFENPDINSILEKKQYIKKCDDLKELIKDEYQIMFGKEMKIVEDDD